MKLKKLFNLFAVIALTGSLFLAYGCEKDDDEYGNVLVINATGYTIITDVRWGDMEPNEQRTVADGEETLYERVPAGDIEIWGKIDLEGYTWEKEEYNLKPNIQYNFTWTPPSD